MSSIPDPAGTLENTTSVMSSLEHESNDLWKQHRLVAVATLTIPLWLSTAVLVAAFLWQGTALVRKLLAAAFGVFLAGRIIILGGDADSVSSRLSAAHLAFVALYLDTIWAVVLSCHAGFLFHVPWLGRRLKAAVCEGNDLLQRNRWMRRLTVAAVLLFVMLPVSSTGSIGGSLLGRLLGLSRLSTVTVVLIGSLLGGILMLLGAELLAPWVSGVSPAVRYGGLAAIVVLAYVLSRRYRMSLAD